MLSYLAHYNLSTSPNNNNNPFLESVGTWVGWQVSICLYTYLPKQVPGQGAVGAGNPRQGLSCVPGEVPCSTHCLFHRVQCITLRYLRRRPEIPQHLTFTPHFYLLIMYVCSPWPASSSVLRYQTNACYLASPPACIVSGTMNRAS